jgi:hypothetical protein
MKPDDMGGSQRNVLGGPRILQREADDRIFS